ncbi:hypothetical protein QVD17_15391 [Tagetes erecta]|uniref:DUF4219 domain-containing protein n=1 Tax=Tagetes erecta TaxID=13708 RepID=A0AAD8KPL0_TARER|nr:hypothetical protein QVD17_15391 [Tagetes erecta]
MAEFSNRGNPTVSYVPVFKGESYQHWSLCMKTILRSKELWDVVYLGITATVEGPRDQRLSGSIEDTTSIIEVPIFQETVEEETGSELEAVGEMAMVFGPKDVMSSGLGGLGLEGMMGSDDSVGASSPPLGVGNKGVISGDKAGEGEDNGDDDDDIVGSNAGAAEIVLVVASDNLEHVRHKVAISKIMSVDGAIR